MMKILSLTVLCFVYSFAFSQSIDVKISNAVKQFEADSQFKHALISLYVVDSKTGKPVFDKNSQVGLAPASCLKVITSAAAFDLLGKDYRYKTEFGYSDTPYSGILEGNLIMKVSGDPTFGSWRWQDTKMNVVMQKIFEALKAKNIKMHKGTFVIDDSRWATQTNPGGWPSEDMGNYYGAGAAGLNWHENQYDIILKPGKKVGDSVDILRTDPLSQKMLINELRTGRAGSGDNSIVYLPEDGLYSYVRGTIPAGVDSFKISAAMPNGAVSFMDDLGKFLFANGITLFGGTKNALSYYILKKKLPVASTPLLNFISPPLDSINYWFLQKSINLYGEAFVKTIAYEKTGFGATDTGINIIKYFWSKNGIEKSALHIIDGSGLSPANRVTTNALVTVMQFARNKNWFASFYNALPVQNGIKMKSGYIGGVRSYTGYIKSRSGTEYTFSFIINNYDGNPGTVREKMWKLLDILKAP